jgi:hypothetical protein
MKDWILLQIPLPNWLWLFMSVGLLSFSVLLLLMKNIKKLAELLIIPVIFSDISWVLLTSAGLIYYFYLFSVAGMCLVILINLIVSTIAWFQYIGYKNEVKKMTD